VTIVASHTFPRARQAREWPQVREGVGITVGFGEQIVPVPVGVHDAHRAEVIDTPLVRLAVFRGEVVPE
jgi:hypothetical protein